MSINATVTAKSGPGLQTTAGLLANAKTMSVDPDRGIVTFTFSDDSTKEFSLDGVTTFTISISGKTYTVVIS